MGVGIGGYKVSEGAENGMEKVEWVEEVLERDLVFKNGMDEEAE